MDNLASVRNDTGRVRRRRSGTRHTWIMSFLYIGTFGSFIGYSFAFGLVLQNQFGRTPLQAAVDHLHRPAARLADPARRRAARRPVRRRDGSRSGTSSRWRVATGGRHRRLGERSRCALFVAGFIVLFVLTGLGNGSTYKMIPGDLPRPRRCGRGPGAATSAAAAAGRRLSGAAMGLIGAVGALGGV